MAVGDVARALAPSWRACRRWGKQPAYSAQGLATELASAVRDKCQESQIGQAVATYDPKDDSGRRRL